MIIARIVRPAALIAATCAVFGTAAAQQAVTRIEGKVTDEVTGAPVECKMYVYTPSGKKTSQKSGTDGTYLVVINEAGDCKFVFAGYNVYRKEETLNVPQSTQFKDIKRDFKVRALKEGTPIFSVRGFERNSANLTTQGRKELEGVAEQLRVNQEMNVLISVVADEDQLGPVRAQAAAEHAKAMDAWKKAVKKTKKGATPPDEPVAPVDPVDPNVQLLKDRINAVKNALSAVKNVDVRVKYAEMVLPSTQQTTAAAAAPVAPKKGKGKGKSAETPAQTQAAASSHATLVASVGKVKQLFD